MLSGKKTYFISGLIVLISSGFAFGLLEAETFMQILGILIGTGGMALRHAIEKLEK